MPSFSITQETYGTFPWLLREVGIACGKNPDSSTWTHPELRVVESVIESGVYQFYFPGLIDFRIPDASDRQQEALRRSPHTWTFLQKIASISIADGTTAYALPSDFAKLVGQITTTRSGNSISIVSESQIRQMLTGSSSDEGPPRYAALRHNAGDGTADKTYQLIVYPTPEASETIEYQYAVNPPALNESAPWPLSGREHAETLKACCLAVAAERGLVSDPVQAERYISGLNNRLAASIQIDLESAAVNGEIWEEEAIADMSAGREFFERQIGISLEIGPNPKSWSSSDTAKVREIYKMGMRRFINPPAIAGEKYPHIWSFLEEIGLITTVAETYTYDLPSDFAYIEGELTYAAESGTLYPPLIKRSEGDIRQKLQLGSVTTRPMEYAVRAKDYDPAVGTRYELLLYPIPDGAFALNFRYRVSPEALAQ